MIHGFQGLSIVFATSRPDPIQFQSAIVRSARVVRSDLAFTTAADIYSEIQARLDLKPNYEAPRRLAWKAVSWNIIITNRIFSSEVGSESNR